MRSEPELCDALPTNQYALALRATAWRLLGDSRYSALCDYRSLVAEQELDTPAGFDSLGAFLSELSLELQALHSFHTHPLQQSVRGMEVSCHCSRRNWHDR